MGEPILQELDKIIKRYQTISRISAAFFYAICVTLALNLFWEPGGVYASGITGAAQLVSTVVTRWFDFAFHTPFGMMSTGGILSTGTMLFILNVPLFILAWNKIGHRFTIFTMLSVLASTIMLRLLHFPPLTKDPILCGIFGAVINGLGTRMALRNYISTGGLDILGLVIRKKTGSSIGQINIAFNFVIVIFAGFLLGWPHALISALSIFINGRMIVTSHPKEVIAQIQADLRRGITIVHDAEGAFRHEEKTILFTVISQAEMYDFEVAMKKSDPYAFVSITQAVKILGRFYEPEIR